MRNFVFAPHIFNVTSKKPLNDELNISVSIITVAMGSN